MIIIAGHLRVAVDDRERLLALSREAVELARATPGCHDFVVAPDLLDAERVNVYERWADRASVHAFRGDGPTDEINTLIVGADVGEFEVLPAADDATP